MLEDNKLHFIQAVTENLSVSSWLKFSSYHHWNILAGLKFGMFSDKKEIMTWTVVKDYRI